MHEAEETSAPSEDVPSHYRKDGGEDKIHLEAVLYQLAGSFEPETLLSRVEQISIVLKQNFPFEGDLPERRVVHWPDLESLTVTLREVAQLLLEVNLVRLKSFETPSHLRGRTADSRREIAICLAELSSLFEGLFSLPLTAFGSNSEIVDLLLLLKASLCVLTKHEGYR
ncbi:MAG: hypothetical protein HKL81_01030 [Acidimicrobiaceae bacterium]|nr:hypothetical protein [Acidimicrobiaceae bacterium]